MGKVDLGTKRACGKCGAKFYDMSRKPILCPKCGVEFIVSTKPVRAVAAPAVAIAPAVKVVAKKAVAEVISLEDAELEQTGKKKAGDPDIDVDVDDDFEIEDETLDDDDDDTFLEEEEEGDDDVSGLIGGAIDADDEEV